jgi:hypothetical protein
MSFLPFSSRHAAGCARTFQQLWVSHQSLYPSCPVAYANSARPARRARPARLLRHGRADRSVIRPHGARSPCRLHRHHLDSRGRSTSRSVMRCTARATGACSCTPPPSYVAPLSLHPTSLTSAADRRGHWRDVRRRAALPRVLRRDGLRGDAGGGHGALRARAARPRRRRAAHQGPLQRGLVRAAPVGLPGATEVRDRAPGRDEPRVLPRAEQERQGHHRDRDVQRHAGSGA